MSPIERGVAVASREAKDKKTEKKEKTKGGSRKTKKEEEDKEEAPSLRKRVQMAEARARRAEKEAKELKTKLDAAMEAAVDGTTREREDPALRNASSEVALFALESDVRIKTQELREAQAQGKEQQERIESYKARVRQLEGQLEAEKALREKNQEQARRAQAITQGAAVRRQREEERKRKDEASKKEKLLCIKNELYEAPVKKHSEILTVVQC